MSESLLKELPNINHFTSKSILTKDVFVSDFETKILYITKKVEN